MKLTMILTVAAVVAGLGFAIGGYVDPQALLYAPALAVGMLGVNQKASEVVAVCETIDPVAQGVGSVSSGWVAAKDFHRFMAVIEAGVLGAAATLDGKLEQATSSGGAGAKDITGKAITQLTKAGADDNKQAVINLNPAQDLDIDNSYTHFRVTLTVAAAASQVGAVILGLFPKYGPASDTDVSTVDEIVG